MVIMVNMLQLYSISHEISGWISSWPHVRGLTEVMVNVKGRYPQQKQHVQNHGNNPQKLGYGAPITMGIYPFISHHLTCLPY